MSMASRVSETNWSVERLMTPLPPVAPDVSCQKAFETLAAQPTVPSLAVVAGKRPLGLISRQDFLAAFSQPLVRAVYERRTVERLIQSPYGNRDPLIVDADLGLEELKEIITTEKPSAVVDGFIITRDGEYAGIGSGVSLLGLSLERARGQIADLEQARLAAQQANQAKSTFLASISHELRTPLNAVIGFSEVLQQQFYGQLNDKQTEYVSDILRSGTHLLELINDILDLSKAEAGKLELPYRTLRIIGDIQKLKQVAINLLANAVKFTPDGGAIRVTVMIARDGAPSLMVEDAGIGIAPDEMERVLKPFERAESQANLALEGTGIGLPLSKSIVERHGGTLHLASELGRGTTVVVRLPPERLRAYTAMPHESDWPKARKDAQPRRLFATG